MFNSSWVEVNLNPADHAEEGCCCADYNDSIFSWSNKTQLPQHKQDVYRSGSIASLQMPWRLDETVKCYWQSDVFVISLTWNHEGVIWDHKKKGLTYLLFYFFPAVACTRCSVTLQVMEYVSIRLFQQKHRVFRNWIWTKINMIVLGHLFIIWGLFFSNKRLPSKIVIHW